MIELYAKHGPWLLSTITILLTVLQGNKHKNAWLLTLINQALWLAWIVLSGTWGFILLNLSMWVVCFRNHLKWKKESKDVT